jgi:hypothetical protein
MLGPVGYVFLFNIAFFERDLLGFVSLVQIVGEGASFVTCWYSLLATFSDAKAKNVTFLL